MINGRQPGSNGTGGRSRRPLSTASRRSWRKSLGLAPAGTSSDHADDQRAGHEAVDEQVRLLRPEGEVRPAGTEHGGEQPEPDGRTRAEDAAGDEAGRGGGQRGGEDRPRIDDVRRRQGRLGLAVDLVGAGTAAAGAAGAGLVEPVAAAAASGCCVGPVVEVEDLGVRHGRGWSPSPLDLDPSADHVAEGDGERHVRPHLDDLAAQHRPRPERLGGEFVPQEGDDEDRRAPLDEQVEAGRSTRSSSGVMSTMWVSRPRS